MNVSIVVPAYNEEEAIRSGLEKFIKLNLPSGYEILYINDGSSDDTGKIISEYPVKLYNHNVNKGYGAALKTGIRKAQGDKVIILDSDGQHDPTHIQKIIDMLDDYDMVIGERTDDSFQVKNRQSGKKIIRWIGEYMVEQKLPDYNSGFRGFNRKIISEMLHLMPNGFSFSTTSTLAFLKEGYTIGTFPIKVSERVGRKSNVKFAKDGAKTTLLIFRIIMLFNPLKIFFPASLISFLLGVGFGLYGYFLFGRFSNTAILLSVLGMFLFFIGLIADQISMLNRRR
ncbi:MAG: glycosyltransferase family 2 protein [Bacteroidales bacterium]|nr:glycosyltransferase family 2 protein [Bacteroidales bacterium]MCF8402503.1 glycosyltransferase family 2 protein [Bacteroidales bacterium]